MPPRFHVRIATLAAALTAACGDPDRAGEPGDAAPSADAGPGAAPAGRVAVSERRYRTPEVDELGRSEVLGTFLEGPAPTYHRTALSEGACDLLRYEPVPCGECVGFCSTDGACTPFPEYVSVGTLTIDGLADDVAIDARRGFYDAPDVLPVDLFAVGAPITAAAPGDDVPGFELASSGVADLLAAELGDHLELPATGDLTVRWTPADPGTTVRLVLNSPNQSHGYPLHAIVECAAPDEAGELVVARALLDALPSYDTTRICVSHDCPLSRLVRERRTTSGGGYVVELVVENAIDFGVISPGAD